MQDALENLGVRPDTLTRQEREKLDHDGFLPLSGLLTPGQLGNLRARVDELVQAEGDQAGTEFRQEPGAERLSDLVNKGAVFDICFTHPRVLAAQLSRRRSKMISGRSRRKPISSLMCSIGAFVESLLVWISR